MKYLTSTALIITFFFLYSCGEESKEESVSEAEEVEEMEKEIDPSQLPQNILDSINTRYPGVIIEEAEEVIGEDGLICYEIEFNLNSKETEVLLSASGVLLKEEFSDADDDKD